MASYFCDPEMRVMHVVAGPVNAQTLLRESRWAVETSKHAALIAKANITQWKTILRNAHLERLKNEHNVNVRRLVLPLAAPPGFSISTALYNQLRAHQRGINNAGKVHQLLSAYPLVDLGQVYQVVFDEILGERISMLPVAQR